MLIRRSWWTFRRPAGDEGQESGGAEASRTIEQNPDTGEAVGTGNDARIALLERINDANDAGRAEELRNVHDDDTTSPFEAQKAEPQEPEVKEPEETATEPVVQKIKLKVNGEELELPLDEVIARAQKVESADRYLAEAKKQRTQVQAPTTPTPGPSPEELQRQQDAEDRALVRAIQMGTEEEATAALRKLRAQSTARPSISPDDVTRAIDERLTFNRAIEKFQTDYADIVGDKYLAKMAADMDRELLAGGDTRGYAERYTEIGDQLRSWKSTLVKAPTAAPSMEDKQARKVVAPKPPVAVAAKTKAPAQEEEREESPSEIISRMREQRGGPQWMRQ